MQNNLKKSKKAKTKSKLVKIKKKSVLKVLKSKKKDIKKVVKKPQLIAYQIQTAKKHEAAKGFILSRKIIVWGGVGLALFAVLSIVAAAGNGEKSFLTKLPQAATLNVLGGNEPVSIIATGDVMLARYVELTMRRLNDHTYPFKRVADFLRSADVTVGNLETPLLDGINTPTNSMTFRADPEGVKGLQFAGYDVLSLANNHAMNYKAWGLLKTMGFLKNANISYAGAGENQDGAHSPAVVEVKGKKLAFYSYNDKSIPPGFHGEAKYNEPGIAEMNIEAMQNDVRNALNFYDYVIVSMHAGTEYKKSPGQFQRDFAHAAIDAGASVVLGHHPHVIQPVEYYNDGVIFYSLGNFVFDQSFSQDVKTGLVTRIFLEEDEKPRVELYPVRIENTQPRFLEGTEKEGILRAYDIIL